MLSHSELSNRLIRPPGRPPSTCKGALFRVDGSGDRIADDADPVLDCAQINEGEPGTSVPIRIYRCSLCGRTLPVSTAADGSERDRGEWGCVIEREAEMAAVA